MDEIGRPLYWDLNKHIEAVEQMIRADEIEIAFDMLKNVPAFYRDAENYPKELAQIKKTVCKNLYDAFEYGNDDEEAGCTRAFGEDQWLSGYMFPRADIIAALIEKLNKDNKIPWIFDLGSSHGNLPLGLLKHTTCKFTYLGKSINWRIAQKVKEWASDVWADRPVDGQPTILFNSEVLEHTFSPMDIVISADKMGIDWDYILLSAPLACLGGGLPNYESRRLGHVRGISKKEFVDFANDNFPGYSWQQWITPSQVILGSKPSATNSQPAKEQS